MSSRGLVLIGPFLAAIQGASREPLAFTVQDIANRLTAGGAAKRAGLRSEVTGGS